MYAKELCCRQCGRSTALGATYYCDTCFGPLEVRYAYDAIRDEVRRSDIADGPDSIWRYGPLLPVERPTVDLGTGWTPLLQAKRLGQELGLRDLWIKNDAVNPTYSFKDRNVSVATNAALAMGFGVLACASTGNLAGSVAGFAARAGMRAYVFVPADLEPAKLVTATVCGATLVTIDGNYDQVNRLCTQVADQFGWGFVNINLRPFYSEGSKTLAFEVVEQLGWEAPDAMVIPMGGASLLAKTDKALKELVKVGWLETAPTRLFGAQPEGCAPVVRAFRAGANEVTPVVPDTLAKSLAIGDPADGYFALQAIRERNGAAEAATDDEIIAGIRLLARTEGIFTEMAGGAVVAVARRLRESGALDVDERVVLAITGNGLKTADVLVGGSIPAIHLTRASLGAFEDALECLEAMPVS